MPPWFTDTVISGLLTALGMVIGYFISDKRERAHNKAEEETDERRMLLEAEKQLKKTIRDSNRLWAWNRKLQDHIYKGAPPPPPDPPDDLFDD